MSEMHENNNEIVYAEGFHTVDKRIEPQLEPTPLDEQPAPPEQPKRRLFPVILTLQLVLCILIALSVFLLNITGSSLYDSFRSWYKAEMKHTLISDSFFETVDIPSLLASTADEATPAKR